MRWALPPPDGLISHLLPVLGPLGGVSPCDQLCTTPPGCLLGPCGQHLLPAFAKTTPVGRGNTQRPPQSDAPTSLTPWPPAPPNPRRAHARADTGS